MNLYFIRHGETCSNNKKLYYGSDDSPLTNRGQRQIEELSRLLKNIKFDRIYASEKKRALDTAYEIISDRSRSEVKVDSRINEMNLGSFEGKDYREIEKLYPEHWEHWCNDWKHASPPGGESYVEFYNRVCSFMKDILKLKCKNVLIVTHSGVIRSVYCYVLDNNLDFFWRFSSGNGDISIIKYEYNNLYINSIISLENINCN